MRYQIYLNKETSEYVNKCAKQDGVKPATLLKSLLESMFKIAIATSQATEEEIKQYDEKRKSAK